MDSRFRGNDIAMKYYITTFGCQQNEADSERLASYYQARGFTLAKDVDDADLVVVNTCMVRRRAEDKVLGLINNLRKIRKRNEGQGKANLKIVLTGCMVGAAEKDEKYGKWLRKTLKDVDQFLPAFEIGFEYQPKRKFKNRGLVPIMHGCNNFCSYCIVPYARGNEHSREIDSILEEIQEMADNGYKEVMLLGQNVNSYGADLVLKEKSSDHKFYSLPNGDKIPTVFVKHLGKQRIPTLFPYLLNEVCKIEGIEKVSFMSSNPWDFSDELIEVIKNNPKINREIHLPVQSGDDEILKKMNRWYSAHDYINLIQKIRDNVPGVSFTTDIIVGFPGETEDQFNNTVELCKKVKFNIAYIACYSPRPGTKSEQDYEDDVPLEIKKKRFRVLDEMINS